MKIQWTCPCGKRLWALPEIAGKLTKCPGCGNLQGIPFSRTRRTWIVVVALLFLATFATGFFLLNKEISRTNPMAAFKNDALEKPIEKTSVVTQPQGKKSTEKKELPPGRNFDKLMDPKLWEKPGPPRKPPVPEANPLAKETEGSWRSMPKKLINSENPLPPNDKPTSSSGKQADDGKPRYFIPGNFMKDKEFTYRIHRSGDKEALQAKPWRLGVTEAKYEYWDPLSKKTLNLDTYDDMGRFLNNLGYGHKPVRERDLENADRLANFDVVFLTCRLLKDQDNTGPHLRKYVENGGILYASDLRYIQIAEAFPEYITKGAVKTVFRPS